MPSMPNITVFPGTVKDYMSKKLIVVQSGADLFEVVELFAKAPFSSLSRNER